MSILSKIAIAVGIGIIIFTISKYETTKKYKFGKTILLYDVLCGVFLIALGLFALLELISVKYLVLITSVISILYIFIDNKIKNCCDD